MTEQQAFLAALAEDEDDAGLRGIYSDWLEDHDLPEEADRQRQWPAAKKWLVDFADQCGLTYWTKITYQDVVAAGTNYADNGDYFVQMGSQKAQNLMANEETRQSYWRNWSIITDRPIPGEGGNTWDEKPQPFSCSC